MKEIGKYLKQARIKNGVSLEEASEDLNMSMIQLENIEDGNVRAFKDIFTLRDYVKDYAKYLGLNVNKLSDEFNDFMFERTSKISVSTVMEKKESAAVDEKKKQISSPYTQIKDRKEIPLKPILGVLIGFVLILLIFFIMNKVSSKEPTITDELLGNGSEYYEFTY